MQLLVFQVFHFVFVKNDFLRIIKAFKVTINPLQNVLSTGKLSIGVKIVPVGVARQIEINIGFAVKVS